MRFSRHAVYSLFYFLQNGIYFIIFIFLCSNNTFFIDHVVKFKYELYHAKFNGTLFIAVLIRACL